MRESKSKADGRYCGRPKKEIVGRQAELSLMKETLELLHRGEPPHILIHGPPGIGKSELLKQAIGSCLAGDRQIRAVYLSPSMSEEGECSLAMARELLVSSDEVGTEGSLYSNIDVDQLIERHKGRIGLLLKEIKEDSLKGGRLGPSMDIYRLASAVVLEQGIALMILLDDFDRLSDHRELLGHLLAGEGDRNRKIAWILTSRRPASPLSPQGGNGCLLTKVLSPLKIEESEKVLAMAMGKAGVSFSRECFPAAALFGGIPHLLWQAASSARLAGISAFDDLESFIRFYVQELSSGFLYDYLQLLFSKEGEADSRSLLETMLHLLSRQGVPAEVTGLAREMLKEKEELVPLLKVLEKRGLIECHYERVLLKTTVPMADFCRDQFRRYLEGCSNEEAGSRLFLEKKMFIQEHSAKRIELKNREEMKSFLRSWQDQQAPLSLVNNELFMEIMAGGLAGEKAKTIAEMDSRRVILPKVQDVWIERHAGSDQMPPYTIDLLAILEEYEGRSKWLAVDLRLNTGEVDSGMVDDFSQRCRLLENRKGLRSGELLAWIISGGIFSAEAREMIRKNRFWSSGPEQIRLLFGFCGQEDTLKIHLPEKRTPSEVYSYQMIIPAREDTELVAARALEQLGENLHLEEKNLGQIKMALIEACLNAFEHGQSEEKKVHLTFWVSPGKLTIEVFNRGHSFVPEKIVKPSINEKVLSPHKRGWGLSIIRELMDDVQFVPSEDGTALRMTKYFQNNGGVDAK